MVLGSLLNKIDIFGTAFNFTTFKKEKFTSNLGGFFTVIVGIFSLALFIIFGMPVYKKENPNVLVQTYDLDHFPQYPLKNNKYPIAYRFEDEAKKKIDLDGYVYPYLELIKQKRNETTNDMVTYEKINFQLTPCNASFLNDTGLANALDGWLCVNWDQVNNATLGGLYDNNNNYVFYFKITIFYCKYDGKTYTDCTDYDKISAKLVGKTKIYFSMMVPSVSTTPGDINKPISVFITNMFFTLNPLLMRTDRYYYDYVQLQQDKGWIFEEYTNYDGFTLNRRDTDIQMRTVDDYKNPNTIKTIATCVFYINNRINSIQVNFVKIQYVLANVGGIIKLFTTLFAAILFVVNYHLRYLYIINDIYDFDLGKPGKNSTYLSKKLNNNSNVGINSLAYLRSNKDDTENPTTTKVNHISIFQTKAQIGRLRRADDPQSNPNNINNDSDFEKILNKENLLHRKKTDLVMPTSFITKRICCGGGKKKDVRSKLYSKAEKTIREKLDVVYYLRHNRMIDRFMELFLTKEQTRLLKFTKNEVLKAGKDEHAKTQHEFVSAFFDDNSNESEIEQLIAHFSEKMNKNQLSEMDRKVLKIIS